MKKSEGELLQRMLVSASSNKEQAQLKMNRFEVFEAEVAAEASFIMGHLDELKAKIQAQIKSAQNRGGLLVRPKSEYLECLKFDKAALEDLLKMEKGYWQSKLDYVSTGE
mmetsp:Transcript_14968/g.20300  ORF Transcript_14968/g.20300 Transcript_14968/m.20300 type:complete len:110 (-) Transcript_14968:725-1054(-)|eukprot:CAMPEP_0185586756 /NCGR_PEP_ID=MMETSP0434-20130131/45952_1 /TAXON_ID=626734 ORGANISM="Favella taraikaensis, Strain Fe Narragansett Bay" /NCGR_SAMPLE_ID=MMETSP0434 /ASSEMBLY_ACC=CAM_ASM_000379 /LENGTH=109 /DNA_ID=CAMNT_0028208121 /DNA_START=30 /DNA_END=359 /DNA_ORIENTATION=+